MSGLIYPDGWERVGARLVFYKAEADEPPAHPRAWTPVKPDRVPEECRTDDCLRRLTGGMAVRLGPEEHPIWWRVERVEVEEDGTYVLVAPGSTAIN